MNEKGFLKIILIVATIILFAVMSYFVFTKKLQPIVQQSSNQSNQTTPTPSNETTFWKTYRNQQFGIEFEYPEIYEVVIETNRSSGHGLFFVGLRPKDWTNSEQFKLYEDMDYPLGIWVDVMNFDEAATQAGFEKQGDHWVLLGRQGIPGDAKEITVQNWKGLRGITSIGFFSKSGGHAGLGEKITAVVNHDNDLSAFFEMTPLISEEIFDKVVSTFRFIK